MPIKSRRKLTEADTEMPQGKGYCRRCQKILPLTDFFSALDFELDKNLHMSICKTCCNELYNGALLAEKGVVEKAVLKVCKMLNMKFSQEAINAAKSQTETNKSDPSKFLGLYKAKLVVVGRENVNDGADVLNLIYQDSPNIIINQEPLQDDEFEEARDLKAFWNTDSKEDIEFLENEFSSFKKTHKADTYAEVTLLKEVCYKLLDMSKDRKANKSTDSSLKQLMEVMKNLAISPNMANAASGGKSVDAYGLWLKDIEDLTPAEWIKDKSIYADVDNINDYEERIIKSPIRQVVTGSREFSIDESEEIDDLDGEQ